MITKFAGNNLSFQEENFTHLGLDCGEFCGWFNTESTWIRIQSAKQIPQMISVVICGLGMNEYIRVLNQSELFIRHPRKELNKLELILYHLEVLLDILLLVVLNFPLVVRDLFRDYFPQFGFSEDLQLGNTRVLNTHWVSSNIPKINDMDSED